MARINIKIFKLKAGKYGEKEKLMLNEAHLLMLKNVKLFAKKD